MNAQNLLEQFLGTGAAQSVGTAVTVARDKVANNGMAGVAGGLAAGGLLGVLIGNKKMRKKAGKLAGGVVGYGGAAALGALAYRAYQNWQSGQQPVAAPTAASPATTEAPPADSAFLPANAPASDGRPFELALVLAMIAAANADGHIDAEEQKRIFERVGAAELGAEDKGFVFDALSKPPSLQDVASLAEGPEQGAEIYLASRLSIDTDHPMEQAYLDALAARLALPEELVAHLEAQVAATE
ncbi:tellurite resistance TerB family protein [Nisaea acidiphila]|uniref:Tellurite resistance TerB family protein n=1 Tax=Nisaea acidiphila TaxID=1862145 RepID=A0A9J7AZ94_9PROT|nr:tellurite resistance TerB family protein [Nisaea acidiphila]UUX50765.1 tellurite resistance TerB family protein [Nisaea acidiphila]